MELLRVEIFSSSNWIHKPKLHSITLLLESLCKDLIMVREARSNYCPQALEQEERVPEIKELIQHCRDVLLNKHHFRLLVTNLPLTTGKMASHLLN